MQRDGLLMKVLKSIRILILGVLISISTFHLSKAVLNKGASLAEILLSLLLVVSFVTVSIFLQTIIHELGHVIFGRFTKYEFISMRIGSIVFASDSGRLRIQRSKVPGTLGQSIVAPKAETYIDQPYLLFCMGGIIANFLFSIIILMLTVIFNIGFYFNVCAYIIVLIGLAFILNNGIPRRVNGLVNDGALGVLLYKSRDACKFLFTGQKMYALLHKGIGLSQMPDEWFEMPDIVEIDLNNPLIVGAALNRCSWLMARRDFDGAMKICQHLSENLDPKNMVYLNEAKCELLFLKIIKNSDEIEKLYTNDLKKYLTIMGRSLSYKRLMFAIHLIHEKNIDKADKIYHEMQELGKTYLPKGQASFELGLVEHVKFVYTNKA